MFEPKISKKEADARFAELRQLAKEQLEDCKSFVPLNTLRRLREADKAKGEARPLFIDDEFVECDNCGCRAWNHVWEGGEGLRRYVQQEQLCYTCPTCGLQITVDKRDGVWYITGNEYRCNPEKFDPFELRSEPAKPKEKA